MGYAIASQPATIDQREHAERNEYMHVDINGRSGVMTIHFMCLRGIQLDRVGSFAPNEESSQYPSFHIMHHRL